MPRVEYKPGVRTDIATIVAYLDAHDARAGDRFLIRLESAIPDLAGMPGKGSPKHFRSQFLYGIRSWSVRGYRQFLILYRPISDGIEIIAVTHGARRLRSILHERLR